MSVGWNLNESTISLPPKNLSFFQQNDCTPPKYGEQSDYCQVEDPSSRCGSIDVTRGGGWGRDYHSKIWVHDSIDY